MAVVLAICIGSVVAVPASNASANVDRRGRPTRPFGSVCPYSHTSGDDPIVHPGMTSMAHSHDFFGNTSTNAFSTEFSLATEPTTCKLQSDRSAYWAPTLYNDGVAVTPIKAHAYYARRVVEEVENLPFGLRIIAGDRKNVRYSCIVSGMPQRLGHMVRNCEGGMFTIGIKFPECWNGTDLDSPDHKSHMAYAVGEVCPESHPIAVPRLRLFLAYPARSTTGLLTLASGSLDTAHADFMNAWDPEVVAEITEFCLNDIDPRNCSKRLPKFLREQDKAFGARLESEA